MNLQRLALAGTTNRMFYRVFGVFVSLLLVITAMYGLLIIPLQKSSLLKVMYSQAVTVSSSITQACSDAFLTDDIGFVVEHNLQVLKNNQSMLAVLIVPKNGAMVSIAPQGWKRLGNAPTTLPASIWQKESFSLTQTRPGYSIYRYSTPIRFSGVSWGYIQIDFSTAEYDANIKAMYYQMLLISLLVVAAMLPMGYWFARWLTRPIVRISEAAAQVAQGDFSARVSISRNDEIGQLSSNFNLMVDTLQQNRDRLQNANLELEHKVAERTHALDELNHSLDQRVRDEILKRKAQENRKRPAVPSVQMNQFMPQA